jgi:hypothetical protein
MHAPSHSPQIRGTLTKGSTVIDTCVGNWLHYLEWDKGVNKVSNQASTTKESR